MSGILFVKLLFHEGNGDFHEVVAEVNGGKGGNHKHEKRPSADVKAVQSEQSQNCLLYTSDAADD